LPEGERPVLLYAGDGVSDLSAAAETNLLFAKAGKGKFKSNPAAVQNAMFHCNTNKKTDLVTFCERRGMPFTTFENWSTILSTTQDILAGKVSPADVAKVSKTA
jgi:2-hydroxy-3-keto-5-methylthiopentenyl-1-phosphate phosphatase